MELMIYPKTLQDLKTLQAEKKFVEESMYPGAPDEDTRIRCESLINKLLGRLIDNVEHNPQPDFVKDEFLKVLPLIEEEDTEEREAAWDYLARIMAILGIYISDENLNEWLYGVAPNWVGAKTEPNWLAVEYEIKEQARERNDKVLWDALGEENGSGNCRNSQCSHKHISLSAFCRKHHFEMIRGYGPPETD